MYSIKLFISLIAICLGLGIVLAAAAQETTLPDTDAAASETMEEVTLDENVEPEDLGVAEPTILPDSPFYFFKNLVREVQSAFTFNTIKKAELRMKFANEKLMETKKMVEETKDPEVIKKAAENYRKEAEKIKEQVEKIKEKAGENPQVESFLDKFINQETLHQKLLQKLETQVPTQALEKIREAREEHLEKFKDVMLKLENRKEVIIEKLDKILEEQKGSQFKNFKNLEILNNLEEKMPEEAKEAIQKAQENILTRLKEDLGKISPEDQERFKEYAEKISGQKEKHLEILEELKLEIRSMPETSEIRELKEKLEEGKINMIEKIEKGLEKLDCPLWAQPAPGFCNEGKIIIKKDPETGCPMPPKCVMGEIECEVFITCEAGYIPVDTGEKDLRGCPIKKCAKKEETEKSTAACITLWDPVCGEDGKTYSNSCFAELAGAAIAYKGKCGEKECQTDADCPQLRCGSEGAISASRCIGVKVKCVNGRCTTIEAAETETEQ